jgi:DNA-binding GntR family transcriptional regulator
MHAEDENFKAGKGYYLQEGQDDFHYCIIKSSGNKTLEKMLCDELYHLIRMYRIQFSNTPNRPSKAWDEHIRILDAIAEGDGELAEMLITSMHLTKLLSKHCCKPKENITWLKICWSAIPRRGRK